eukprot:TRINITY_DN30876_c0_g1_i1.p1 TRINITY_DN30876_c0_g1~~TRINITY_DN30876_c0_g1_i1.p1  ORF type:complete len:487 (-),score=61.32 TRINITY_DN30876_c0_g1_i1:6-1466(-)
MKTGIVFRQGRKLAISSQQKILENWCCESIFLPIVSCVALVGLPFNLYTKEAFFQKQQLAFAEVEEKVQQLPDTGSATLNRLTNPDGGDFVHFYGPYNATIGDSAFSLRFDHALKLHRYTEYCQWEEHSHDQCQTCTSKDSNGNEETYDCNCVREYTYVKDWRDRLIPSFGFDQPANHNNPQRDPFPSTNVFSDDAVVGDIHVDGTIVENIRSQMDHVTFTANGQPFKHPSPFTRFWHYLFGAPEVRFENLAQLRSFRESVAFAEHHFVFTNTWEGWFFAAYEERNWERVIRGFGQYLEGSLFDWQIGDLYDMFNGCTAGDLRSRFYVASPVEISVLGKIQKDGRIADFRAAPYHTSNNFAIGILHAGHHSADQLFARETRLAHNDCRWARWLNLLSGVGAVYLSVHFGLWHPGPFLSTRGGVAIGISLTLMSLVWVAAYGLSDWSGGDSDLWTIMVGLAGIVLVVLSWQYDAKFLSKSKIRSKMS